MADLSSVIIADWNLGGLADSIYSGPTNSSAELVGLDLHSEPGILKVNQKLTKDSGSTVDDFCIAGLACSDGSSYFFGSTNGKIFKRTSGGTWSVEATAAPAAGNVGILAAAEYQGYIYYAMQSRLGRVAVGAAWSTRNDSFATFTNTDATYHPMFELNEVLYIGDKYYVAQVDAGVFSANALDIDARYRVSALGFMNTDLLIGTYIASNVGQCAIFRWNTWSDSYSVSDSVPEVGVNAFLSNDNQVIVSAGTKGNLYVYDGVALRHSKQIKGDYSGTNKAVVYNGSVANFHGMPLFGLSNSSGNPATLGLYSLAAHSAAYQTVLNVEYLLSPGNASNVLIGSILAAGDDLFVAWKDTTSGTVYGVDKLDSTAKHAGAYMVTRVMQYNRFMTKKLKVEIAYRTLNGATLTLTKKVNHTAYAGVTLETDANRLVSRATIDLPDVNTLQLKLLFNASSNNTPEIESIILRFV
ncbi:MAG: hypothetical protein WC052_05250 [Patescibacteria group bacterium]